MDFKKPVYEQVMKVFSPYLQGDADEGNCSAQSETNAKVHMKPIPL